MSHQGAHEAVPADPLLAAVAALAESLPAQGPIDVFIHHNSLHAFEHMPFEQAVVEAGRLFSCEPFVSEARYRAKLSRGRIQLEDLEAVLAADLGETAETPVAGVTTRRALRTVLLTHGIPPGPHPQVEWLVHETDVLDRLRPGLPAQARRRLLNRAGALGATGEQHLVRALWNAALEAIQRAAPPPVEKTFARRHRDIVLSITGSDPDVLVHPLLIRCSAAYLDQGIAYWPAPGRNAGFHEWFLRLYKVPDKLCREKWIGELQGLLGESASQDDELALLRAQLSAMGVEHGELAPFLVSTGLALRGWAGMMRQFEERPDRVPVRAPPARLTSFLAVRLLLDRAAASFLLRQHGLEARLDRLWHERRSDVSPPTVHATERAWLLFHTAQLLGLSPSEVNGLPGASVDELLGELAAFDGLARRALFQTAFERRHRTLVLDALVSVPPGEASATPKLQAIFCLDDREESLRRHCEEISPSMQTFGAAGFFGVAMYYRGMGDAHARPLCPVAIKPEHSVDERPFDSEGAFAAAQRSSRQELARFARHVSVGSQTLFRGTLIATLAGALAAVPLTLRVLFPRIAGWVRKHGTRLVRPARRTQLALDRSAETPLLGRHSGFDKDEMASIVGDLLEDMGLTHTFAPLVLVVGHGSSSLNNPHESAYDCGACGGGRGGPNARAFAKMANDPAVRSRLRERGVHIPEQTWFVGAEHDTCNDHVEYFDVSEVPSFAASHLADAVDLFDRARQRNARERVRRFDHAPRWGPAWLASAHVEARSEDLAQPRPEYGHATNAVCVVGRRARTRNVFLDRRAFLVSYDPDIDGDGAVLGRVLAAVVPVVAGISLEYYFSHVDPSGYGCSTKLPHNVTGLLGVMDGHASDLRTGLTWQMVEIHEPMRLLLVIETTPEIFERVLRADARLSRLVHNRWIRLALMTPDGAGAFEFDGSFRPYRPSPAAVPVVATSTALFRGKRGHLNPALIRPREPGGLRRRAEP